MTKQNCTDFEVTLVSYTLVDLKISQNFKHLICQFLCDEVTELDNNHELSFIQKISDLIDKIKTVRQITYAFEVDGKCKISSSASQSNQFKIPKYSILNEMSVGKQTNKIIAALYLVAGLQRRRTTDHGVSSMNSQSTIMSSQAANQSFNGSEHGAHVSKRGMSISDSSFNQDSESEGELTNLKNEKAFMVPRTVAKDFWQRKHHRFVLSALKI